MASLADLVLASTGDEDLEDAELLRELEELRARRKGSAISRPGSALPRGTLEADRESEAAAAKADQEAEAAARAQREAEAATRAKRIAKSLQAQHEDSTDGPPVPVDPELEAMEKELARRVAMLKGQQADAGAKDAALAAPKQGRAENLAETAPLAPELCAHVDNEELLKLRTAAAQMEEAFPEPAGPDGPAAQLRRRAGRTLPSDVRKDDAPMDRDVTEMRRCLEDLDVQLRALQTRQACLTRNAPRSSDDEPSRSRRAAAQLQAQNEHLRQRLNGAGVWNIDRNLFTAVPLEPGSAAVSGEGPPAS